jgi:DNA-binding response OmpR family regulator
VSLPRILSICFDNISGVAQNGILAQAGYRISSASSTTEAFELLNKEEFVLVIMGHSVPTAERRLLFLEIKRKWETPVLMVESGEADPLIRAHAHVNYTATADELLATVAALLPPKRPAANKKNAGQQ